MTGELGASTSLPVLSCSPMRCILPEAFCARSIEVFAMPTKKRLFIGIAVAKPAGMTRLPGVYAALDRISDFARASERYDDPILITDEKKGVTSADLVEILTQGLLLDRPRINVYFCGDGAFSDGIEVWYLSDGQNHWHERLDVMAFRDVLATYGPQQISIFSDACQTATTHPTRASPILDEYLGSFTQPDYDIFRATIRGEAAFSTPADGPLFSKVMAEALSPEPPASALDEPYRDAYGRCVVSNQSLKRYVKANLPDYAAIAGRKQRPELMLGLTYHTNDYLEVTPAPASVPAGPEVVPPEGPIDLTEIATSARANRYRSPDQIEAALRDSQSEWREPFWNRATQIADRLEGISRLLVVVNGTRSIDEVNVLLHPADEDVALVPDGILEGFAYFAKAGNLDVMLPERTSVLQLDDLFIPLALGISWNLSLIVSVLISAPQRNGPSSNGPHAIGWHEVGFGPPQVSRVTPMLALKGLLEGNLGADTIAPIAAELRRAKHYDPLYGIVAAYLYDRGGDLDSIRKMCYFYDWHGQAVPFDIALLSRLPMYQASGSGYRIDVPATHPDPVAEAEGLPSYVWESTEAREGVRVSGVSPILRAGWTRLETLTPRWSPFRAFTEFADTLTGAPFACVRGWAEGERMIAVTREMFRHS